MSTAVIPPTPVTTYLAGILLPVIAGVLVGLRFYSKHVQQREFFIEDWLTIPAFLATVGMGVCLIYGVAHRALAHPTPQPSNPKDLPTFVAPEITLNRQLEYVVLLLQYPGITCVKLSFLFFYKRIFCTAQWSIVKYMIWAMILICTVWATGFFFSFAFICGTHFSAFWGPLGDFKKHCSGTLNCNFSVSISDFILDLIVFIFPIPLLLRLQMSTTRKLAVLSIFTLGGLTVAASITRMVIFIRAVQNLKKAYKSTGADNGIITAGLYWTTVECGLGLISVCLPSVYALGKKVLEKHFGFKTASSSQPIDHSSSRYSNVRRNRNGHVKLDGQESDEIPLGVPVVTTNIRVDYE